MNRAQHAVTCKLQTGHWELARSAPTLNLESAI
jgi:hypothetical protein